MVASNGFRRELRRRGEFHLAVQFGWLPILKSAQNFVQAQSRGQKRLNQLIRDEGRNIRRRTELPNLGSSVEVTEQIGSQPWSVTGMYPTFSSYNYAGNGERSFSSTRLELYSRVWAVGSFRYLLPPGPRDVPWTRNMRRRLMGSRITPSTLYELMPWSWLIDYFTNLGDFVEAVSGGVADNLVSNYCFIMSNIGQKATVTATEYITPGLPKGGLPSKAITAVTTKELDYKYRVSGSPFGFGVTQGSLTPHQLGILGALGLSRL